MHVRSTLLSFGFVAAAALAQPQMNARLIASDGVPDDAFGESVAIDGDLAVIGVPGLQGGDAPGRVVLFERDEFGQWGEIGTLDAGSNAVPGAQFGYHVAIHWPYLVVGAPWEDNANGTRAGASYIFEDSGNGWDLVAVLTADNAGSHDAFGTRVAVYGETAIVGSPGDDDGGDGAGAAYVYQRANDGSWALAQKLTASDPRDVASFGMGVALDSERLVVSADGNGPVLGSVYVFERDGVGEWVEHAKISADDGAYDDHFGTDVALSGDIIAVGAGLDDPMGSDSGSVYVYELVGSTWTNTAFLTASDGQAGDRFGRRLDLVGNVLAVGAHWNDALGSDSGAAYVFHGVNGHWRQVAKLAQGGSEAHFGIDVALGREYGIVGARGEDGYTGAAYAFDGLNTFCVADVNNDGKVDTLDFLAYLNLWTSGCP